MFAKPSFSMPPQRGQREVAEAEELQARLDRDGDTGDEGRLHERRSADDGQDVAGDDAPIAESRHTGGIDIELVAHRIHGRVDQAVERGREKETEDHDGRPHRGSEHGTRRQQHDDAGQRLHESDEPRRGSLEPLAVVARDQTARDADDCRDDERDRSTRDAEPRCVDQTGEDVPTGAVGSEQVFGRDRAADVPRGCGLRLERRDERAEDCDQHDEEQERQRRDRDRLLHQPAEQGA